LFYVLFVSSVLFYVLFVSIVLFYVLFVSSVVLYIVCVDCVVLCIVCVECVVLYIFFVCKCVLYYCHRVSTQLQLNISYYTNLLREAESFLTVSQLVKKFPAFNGIQRFITAFTSARHLSLS